MISNRGTLLSSERRLSTKKKWTSNVLFRVKQKHNRTERAWDISRNAYPYLECKYSAKSSVMALHGIMNCLQKEIFTPM